MEEISVIGIFDYFNESGGCETLMIHELTKQSQFSSARDESMSEEKSLGSLVEKQNRARTQLIKINKLI